MIKGLPEDDFWEHNWALRYVTEVADLIAAHGEEKAGRYMWAIWLFCSPRSDLFELEPEDKIEAIKMNYLKEPDFYWPEREVFVKPKKKPAKRKPKKDDDFDDDDEEMDGVEMDDDDEEEFDIDKIKLTIGFKEKDLDFKEVDLNIEFYRAMQAFPVYAMSVEEADYYGLVRLRQMARARAEWLNGKDMASAIKALSSSSPDMDKMKARYLTWKEQETRSGGDVQSGGASRRKKN